MNKFIQNRHTEATSFQQQSFVVNVKLLDILRGSTTTQSVQSVLESVLSHITMLSKYESTHENEIHHRYLDISRYQLEILRSKLIDCPNPISISADHRSMMLLETAKVLFQQGFRTLAVNTIREADQSASSSLLSMTCRLEELLLTSANEDESKRLTSVKVMINILENGNSTEEETQQLSTSVTATQDALPPALLSLCLQSSSSFLPQTHRAFVHFDRFSRI